MDVIRQTVDTYCKEKPLFFSKLLIRSDSTDDGSNQKFVTNSLELGREFFFLLDFPLLSKKKTERALSTNSSLTISLTPAFGTHFHGFIFLSNSYRINTSKSYFCACNKCCRKRGHSLSAEGGMKNRR